MGTLLTYTATTGLDQVIGDVGTFFTAAIDWLGTVVSTITSTPLLIVMVIAMPVAGFAVGLLSRLIRL